MKKYMIWTLVIVALVAAGWYAFANQPGLLVKTALVSPKNIAAYVEERARTTLPRTYRVTMPFPATVMPIDVQAGDRVHSGQVVASLEMDDIKTELSLAEADAERLNAEIAVNQNMSLEKTALIEAGSLIESMVKTSEAAHEMVKAKQAQVDYSAWWLNAIGTLRKQQAVADEKYQEARKEKAQAVVDLSTGNLTAKAIDAILEAFRLGPEYVTEYMTVKNGRTDALFKSRDAAQARLAQAQRNVEKASLKSPVDGIILKRAVDNKVALAGGVDLLLIGRLEELEVTADILSQEAARIHPGDRVEMYGEALSDATLHGTVKEVKPLAFTKLSSLGVEQQRVPVIISLPDDVKKTLSPSEQHLGVGYRVRVRIFTQKHDNVLVVPRLALFRSENGQWQVFTVEQGKAVCKTVTVGILNDKEAEITSGLSSGDNVISAPPKNLVNGTRVHAVSG
ncbi:efflux RND transporter periplasmic adaptor subunit [Desulfovibrio inopinatus]|uniref:efflux RND transporter periplasmic adaptor subunit n=1 Tax=Desulfovibrio inopinatus TaxID=102109 RepID=UPI000415ECC0|nr:efflux RND transporter periplasmic adaptor subunit [Desulfovibrio inopinatus]